MCLCGWLIVIFYVADGTYTFTHEDPTILSQVLSNKYKVIEEYLVSNKLVINADKTHLIVMSTKKMEIARQSVELIAGQDVVNPRKALRLQD